MKLASSLSVREATADDLLPVMTIFQQAIQRIASADYDPAQIAAWSRIDPSAWKVPLTDRIRWVAWIDATAAGFADLTGSSHLDRLYVHPDHVRRGVAGKLLETVEATVIANGQTTLTTDASLTARSFFEAAEFHVLAEETVRRNGQKFRRYRMRKDGLEGCCLMTAPDSPSLRRRRARDR